MIQVHKSFESDLVKLIVLHNYLALLRTTAQKDTNLQPTVIEVPVANPEVREQLNLTRFQPDLRVAENYKEIIVRNGLLVSLCQSKHLLLVESQNQP